MSFSHVVVVVDAAVLSVCGGVSGLEPQRRPFPRPSDLLTLPGPRCCEYLIYTHLTPALVLLRF